MYQRAKRSLDFAGSLIVIWVTLPLWLVIGAAIRLTSPGPVFYRGHRIGLNGRPFDMYKFRSMRHEAASFGPGITADGDPRITPVGRLLRRSKLDELPQLINVLRGEMSLVGPRPEAPEYVALYGDREREVLSVPPGITGLTQVRFRHEEKLLHGADVAAQYRRLLPLKLRLDLEYVESRSLWLDLRLILQTVASLFTPATEEGGVR